ncbi:MAG TPA: hypothetical protein VK466_17435, partial [Terriglobales bacterium]|nr:hypothetical protein [Terriglobales bacterium]
HPRIPEPLAYNAPQEPLLPKSAVEVISPAFAHAADQLAEPFRFAQWARIALLALATGELSSGGGCNGITSLPTKVPHTSQNFVEPGDVLRNIDPALIATLMMVLIFGGLVLWLVYIYVSSVTRFMLFEAVLQKNCGPLGEGWQRWQGPGLRYFWWQLALGFVGLAVAGVLFFPLLIPVIAVLKSHRQPGPELLLAFIPMIAVLMIFGLVMHLIAVLAKDFVVPIMALDNVGVIEGWRRFFAILTPSISSYAGYIAMKIVLAIGAAVIFGVAAAIAAIFVILPFGVVAFVVAIAAKGAGFSWNASTITAAIVALTIVLCVVVYAVALACVPIAVFFPAYAMYFLAERYPALHARLYPAYPPPPSPPLAPAPVPIG